MLSMVVKNVITTIQQNAPIFRALVSALPSMKQQQREKYLNQVVMYATGMLESYFAEQIKRGVFCAGHQPEVLSRAFIGMVFPFVAFREVLQVETETDWNYDEVIAEIVPLFLHGVMSLEQDASTTTKRARRIPIQ